jgi:hypothetical protein
MGRCFKGVYRMKNWKLNTFISILAMVILILCFSACDNGGEGPEREPKREPEPSDLEGYISITPDTNVILGTELTANYSGTETVSYQWKRDGTNVGTDNTYKPTRVGEYTVTVSAAGYNSKTSAAVTVHPVPDLTGDISITPDKNVIVGTELTANYSGTETVSYQWVGNMVNPDTFWNYRVTVGTDKTYTPTVDGSYTVTVSAAGYNSKSTYIDVSFFATYENVSGTYNLTRFTSNQNLTGMIRKNETQNLILKNDGTFTSSLGLLGYSAGTYTISNTGSLSYIYLRSTTTDTTSELKAYSTFLYSVNSSWDNDPYPYYVWKKQT